MADSSTATAIAAGTGMTTFTMAIGEVLQIFGDQIFHIDLNNEQAYMLAILFAPLVHYLYGKIGVDTTQPPTAPAAVPEATKG